MTDIKEIKEYIRVQGRKILDYYEVVGMSNELSLHDIKRLRSDIPLLEKYRPELNDIDKWFKENYPKYTRRQIVYFNNNDYDMRLQCISLFQILDTTMVIYQRSSHTEKYTDDCRFFVEIVTKYFPQVQSIKIFYGSLHTQL